MKEKWGWNKPIRLKSQDIIYHHLKILFSQREMSRYLTNLITFFESLLKICLFIVSEMAAKICSQTKNWSQSCRIGGRRSKEKGLFWCKKSYKMWNDLWNNHHHIVNKFGAIFSNDGVLNLASMMNLWYDINLT